MYTLHSLNQALTQLHGRPITLLVQDPVREYVQDSIDLGEVLGILEAPCNLEPFARVQTAGEFVAVLNNL